MQLPSSDSAKWYAVRTAPGAQMPQREYLVEPTRLGQDGKPTGKGYRIVPSLDPHISAIERALRENGFTAYMPVEKRIIRNRRKLNTWTTRRFALLPGYAFVHGVEDWRLLQETAGVLAIVGVKGVPAKVELLDILALRAVEAESDAEVARHLERLAALAAKVTRATSERLFPNGSRIEIMAGHAMGRTATIIGTARGSCVKAIADGLDALGSISVPVDAVRLVA